MNRLASRALAAACLTEQASTGTESLTTLAPGGPIGAGGSGSVFSDGGSAGAGGA